MPKFINIKKHTYGYLKVLKTIGKDKRGRYLWRCKCKCGNYIQTSSYQLRTGRTKSCGCYLTEVMKKINYIHGESKRKTFNIWRNIFTRCYNSKCKCYPHYGGRGITVCKRWFIYLNFKKDMGRCPSKKHSIERINVNKGYTKSNCKWILLNKQGRNRRNSVYIRYKGKKLSLAKVCTLKKLKYHTLYQRLFKCNWSVFKALNTP